MQPTPKQDAHERSHDGPPLLTVKRGGGDNTPNNTLTADTSTEISLVQTSKSTKKTKSDNGVPMDIEDSDAIKKATAANTPSSRLSAMCKSAAARKSQEVATPGARSSETTTRFSPFTKNMTYKKKVTTKVAAPSKFVPTHEQFLLINVQIPPGTRPAAGIRSGVETVFTEIKETTAAEIALMAKDKHHSPIVKKAMLPKKHSEMRFYGEIQVPESDITALVKRKQSRFFPVVIKLGATTPINDDIVAIAVDLADEGIETQLKLFQAWRSYPSEICLAMVPRKARLPYLQHMANQSLAVATCQLDSVKDASITTIDWCNAKLGMNVLLSIGYPPFNNNSYAKGQIQRYDSKNRWW